ncbi:hypothetical protein CYMTET_29536 [Cymbomonas tetramitiformis]|uniref:C3H1-type domain-containing protein n=1 Tax=Cymbomonas tetramitiformis TaxID=36881 RepID=A0AAE0KV25_9CHLO|nr:hypothetical protein CYMTET_29536 [Cymbomonas tetramitiformis]
MEAGPPTTRKTGKAASKGGRGAEKSGVAGKPTKALVCFQWNVGKCFKKGCKYAHECSKKNYVREGFEFKVDKHHQEELATRRVVPFLEGWAPAIHGVGVVDKDHSNLEKGFLATVGYLDDFWVCCPTTTKAQEALLLLGDVLRFLGFQVAEEKCEGPIQDIVFLGVRLCTNVDGEGYVTASLPGKKCLRRRTQVLAQAEKGFPSLDDRPGVGPFSIDACCDESGSNAQTTIFWTVTQECLQQEWEGHNAWCNPPFSKILEILQHFLECKRRQNVGTAACFVMPVWPIADFFKFIEAWPEVFFPLVRFDADADLFIAPAFPGRDRRYFGPTKWPVTIYRVPPRFIDLGENGGLHTQAASGP